MWILKLENRIFHEDDGLDLEFEVKHWTTPTTLVTCEGHLYEAVIICCDTCSVAHCYTCNGAKHLAASAQGAITGSWSIDCDLP